MCKYEFRMSVFQLDSDTHGWIVLSEVIINDRYRCTINEELMYNGFHCMDSKSLIPFREWFDEAKVKQSHYGSPGVWASFSGVQILDNPDIFAGIIATEISEKFKIEGMDIVDYIKTLTNGDINDIPSLDFMRENPKLKDRDNILKIYNREKYTPGYLDCKHHIPEIVSISKDIQSSSESSDIVITDPMLKPGVLTTNTSKLTEDNLNVCDAFFESIEKLEFEPRKLQITEEEYSHLIIVGISLGYIQDIIYSRIYNGYTFGRYNIPSFPEQFEGRNLNLMYFVRRIVKSRGTFSPIPIKEWNVLYGKTL